MVEPLFEELYQSVLSGKEARTVLEANTAPDCREKVEKEVEEMRNSEMSRAGAMVRSPRPEKWKKQN